MHWCALKLEIWTKLNLNLKLSKIGEKGTFQVFAGFMPSTYPPKNHVSVITRDASSV